MNKLLSRIILSITALSAVFFGWSQVFAVTYYYNYTPSSPLISASNPCVKAPMAYSPNSPHGVPLWDSIFVNKSAAFSYITTSNDLVYKYRNGSTVGTGAIISNVDCYSLFGRTLLSNG